MIPSSLCIQHDYDWNARVSTQRHAYNAHVVEDFAHRLKSNSVNSYEHLVTIGEAGKFKLANALLVYNVFSLDCHAYFEEWAHKVVEVSKQ